MGYKSHNTYACRCRFIVEKYKPMQKHASKCPAVPSNLGCQKIREEYIPECKERYEKALGDGMVEKGMDQLPESCEIDWKGKPASDYPPPAKQEHPSRAPFVPSEQHLPDHTIVHPQAPPYPGPQSFWSYNAQPGYQHQATQSETRMYDYDHPSDMYSAPAAYSNNVMDGSSSLLGGYNPQAMLPFVNTFLAPSYYSPPSGLPGGPYQQPSQSFVSSPPGHQMPFGAPTYSDNLTGEYGQQGPYRGGPPAVERKKASGRKKSEPSNDQRFKIGKPRGKK